LQKVFSCRLSGARQQSHHERHLRSDAGLIKPPGLNAFRPRDTLGRRIRLRISLPIAATSGAFIACRKRYSARTTSSGAQGAPHLRQTAGRRVFNGLGVVKNPADRRGAAHPAQPGAPDREPCGHPRPRPDAHHQRLAALAQGAGAEGSRPAAHHRQPRCAE
jgi:hypothetical protein